LDANAFGRERWLPGDLRDVTPEGLFAEVRIGAMSKQPLIACFQSADRRWRGSAALSGAA
jgi:hypothetical protein